MRRHLPLLLLLLTLPFLLGAKGCGGADCAKLRTLLELAKASGNPQAIAAAQDAIVAAGGCPVPEPTPIPPGAPVCGGYVATDCWEFVGGAWAWRDCRKAGCPAGEACEGGHADIFKCEPGTAPGPTPEPTLEPTPTPSPAPGCSIDGEPGALLPAHRPALGKEVNAAMHALRPDCEVGGRCVLPEGRLAWQRRVVEELRRRGTCAGQHAPTTDEIAAATSATAPREGGHVYAGPADGPGTVVWFPQAARPAYAAPEAPELPPPADDACPAAPCPIRTWTAATLPPGWGENEIGQPAYKINAHPHTMGNIDSTVVVIRQEPFCTAIGMSPRADGTSRADCPMRSEDGSAVERVAVENWILFGGYTRDSRNGQDCTPNGTSNPAAFLGGSGNCRMCSANKAACSEWF